ncbi:hypothetical protein D3OALGA1CA_4147 [Olavius algarvensis associated proteobacterium Delta 3]|nr:hypothetical protein D3OALGB2SA_824 [Olavius algarvensis associated proteobacterium Delta 3]CAB5146149.1 hypothetical protein D3OALGA1CA_4147 [Olavius algarvensis associated proteobacterium Delta 3]
MHVWEVIQIIDEVSNRYYLGNFFGFRIFARHSTCDGGSGFEFDRSEPTNGIMALIARFVS